MTTQPGAEPSGSASASQTTKPLREFGALVLVGANAVFLVVALLNLLFAQNDFGTPEFPLRAAGSFDGFVSLTTIALPFVAVLLATHVQPPIARARMVTLVALVEYGISAFFGAFFGVLVGIVGLVERSAWGAFLALLTRLAWLTLLGAAAFTVLRVWNAHFTQPKPQPQPQPQPGFYGPGYGQPGYPQQGGYPYPPYGQPAGFGQPPYGQPSPPQSGATYVSTQHVGSPVSAPPATQPSAQPYSAGTPQSAGPSTPPSPSTSAQGSASDATQAIRVPETPAAGGSATTEDPGRTQLLRPVEQPSSGGDDPGDSQRTQVIKPTNSK